MARKIVGIAALIGAIAVILGAFGAHGLKKIVAATQVESFEVAVRYQMYHALFLLFVGLTSLYSDKVKKTITVLTLVGIIFFSGSIYLLTFKDLIDIKLSVIGPITPIGGVFLIIAWLVAAYQAFTSNKVIK
ncbi:DUF423 domain-containing protein [Myroides sp. LJL119]